MTTEVKTDEVVDEKVVVPDPKVEEKVETTPEDKPDPKPEDTVEEKKDATELDGKDWTATGNDTVDAVLLELQNSGIKPTDAEALLFTAMREGDATKVDQAKLVEAVGKTRAHLIMVGVRATIDESKKAAEVTVKSLHEASGGKDNWDKAAKWAKEGGIPEAKLSEYRDLIDKGGESAAFVAQKLIEAYNKDEKNTTLNGGRKLTTEAANAPTVEPLSSAEYFRQCETARFDGTYATKHKALYEARQAGKKLGK